MQTRAMKKMVILAAAMASLSTVATAQSVSVQPRIGVGVQNYELNFPSVTIGNANGSITFRDSFKVADSLRFYGGGLNLGYRRWFLDLSEQRSGTGHDTAVQLQGNSIGGPVLPATNAGVNHSLDSAFSRKEFNASIGWGFTPEFSAYLGYKHSAVDIASMMLPQVANISAVVPNDVLFFGTRRIAFNYNGFFAGGTYSIPVAPAHGAFAIQSSIVRLNGVYRETFDGTVGVVFATAGTQYFYLNVNPAFANRDPLYGKSTGLNLGLSWTGTVPWLGSRLSGLSYAVGVDRSQYKFTSQQTVFGNFEETNTRYRLDVRYRFTAK